MDSYIPEKAKIVKRICFTYDTSLFRLEKSMKHKPGQFVEVSVLGIGEGPISICSFSDGYLDLCIKKVGTLTGAIHKLREGDGLFIRGPYGNGYPMEEFVGRDVVLVGGGTGTASLAGVIEYIRSHRKDFARLQAYFGFREPKEILFRDSIKKWKEEFDCNITVDKCDEEWQGNVCVVPSLVEKAEISKEAIVIICGPPIMIHYTMQALQKKNIPEEQIYVSLERLMKCGIGKCGRCQAGSKYVCKDGPVFRYDQAKDFM